MSSDLISAAQKALIFEILIVIFIIILSSIGPINIIAIFTPYWQICIGGLILGWICITYEIIIHDI